MTNSDEKSTNSVKLKSVSDIKERVELFKQVAIAVLSSRQALVITGSAEGKVVASEFVSEVALITEGILNASKQFGEA